MKGAGQGVLRRLAEVVAPFLFAGTEKQETEEEMELRELRLIIRHQFPIALIAFLICIAGGAAAAYLPAKTYRTNSAIVLDINNAAETTSTVQQISFLLPALEERTESRSLKEAASVRVPEQFRDIRVDIQAISDSSVLRVRGSSKSPGAAAAWVNAIAAQLAFDQSTEGLLLQVLDPAPVKTAPVSPKATPILVASIVVGIVAGLFAALTADRVKRALDTNHAVRSRLGTTVLGEVPVLRRRSEARHPIISLLDDEHPSNDVITAFESIRTNVELRMAELGADRVAVVSLNRDTGKSTISAGLSYGMAMVGRSVVAIEADLRNPTLSEQLGVVPKKGLGDIASSDDVELELQNTRHPSLKFLSAGIPAGRAADVIATTLPNVVQTLSEGGRTLVIDGPPLIGAPESTIIVSQAHYVILAVNNNSSDFASLSDAVDRITDAGGVLLGIIINRVPRRRIQRDLYEAVGLRVADSSSGTGSDQGDSPKRAGLRRTTKKNGTSVTVSSGTSGPRKSGQKIK